MLARGSGQRLLVAVGDRDAVELLTSTLELAGYRTGAAASGAEVARRLAEHPYDLVVIDAELPGLDDLAPGGRLEPALPAAGPAAGRLRVPRPAGARTRRR
ncbi:response regulator [Streptomyces sp. NPDC001714]|uniref:response regulator n=1 Tax=Streptomyces sp. NPDC001714 TaxID=3364603 RepID=UPI0036CB2DED